MRSILATALVLVSTAAFGQGAIGVEYGSIENYRLDVLRQDRGYKVMNQPHVQRSGLNDFWMKQADSGKELTMPYLVIALNSSVGDVGQLPNGRIGMMEFRYILHSQQGNQAWIECQRHCDGRLTSRIEVLLKNASTAGVFNGGMWDPVGYWQITGIESGKLVVEPLPDGEVEFPDVRYHFITSKEKPRDWKIKDDKSKFTGIYLGYDKPTVWVLVDNAIQKHNLFTLSESDQAFVRKELKAGRVKHYLRKLEPENFP